MTIWLFYRKIKNLEPFLYAFTDKVEIADRFGEARKSLHRFSRKCSKLEFRDMRDKLGDLFIMENRFTTKIDDKGLIGSVGCYATMKEAEQFCLYKERIATTLLGLTTISPDIFEDDMRDLLNCYGYTECFLAIQEEPDLNRFGLFDFPTIDGEANLFHLPYKLNELNLFIKQNESTFFKE